MMDIVADFLPRFAQGLATNFAIALAALGIGLVAGAALAWARCGPTLAAAPASALVALLRAAPTFVLIFFLLNAVPWPWTVTPWGAVVVALGGYATAYVSDSALDALRQRAAGHPGAWGLLATSLVRALFVMVLSSGFAATVGVSEAVSVTMKALERLPHLADKLLLVALVMALFTGVFQAIYAVVDRLRDRWSP